MKRGGRNKMVNPSKCPFCEVGQYNRMLMWRLMKGLSRSQLTEMIAEKKSGKIKFIVGEKKKNGM